jgi:hypothetical protein
VSFGSEGGLPYGADTFAPIAVAKRILTLPSGEPMT